MEVSIKQVYKTHILKTLKSIIHRLKDVLDLAWSAKDQFLASCSVDNTIIIWNALKFPDIITRINAHNGFVKGVAWDPVGTFFASQVLNKQS